VTTSAPGRGERQRLFITGSGGREAMTQERLSLSLLSRDSSGDAELSRPWTPNAQIRMPSAHGHWRASHSNLPQKLTISATRSHFRPRMRGPVGRPTDRASALGQGWLGRGRTGETF